MTKLTAKRRLRKIDNLTAKCKRLIKESYDYSLMGTGAVWFGDGVPRPKLLPTFESTAACMAEEAGKYARTAAHHAFVLFPDLRETVSLKALVTVEVSISAPPATQKLVGAVRGGKSWFQEQMFNLLMNMGGVLERDETLDGLHYRVVTLSGTRYMFVNKAVVK